MEIKLWFGYGFIGKEYFLQVDNKFITLGLNCSEEEAASKASDILKQRNIEFDLSGIKFNWDGTL